MFKSVIALQLLAGLYKAPAQDAQHKLIVKYSTFADTVNIRAIYDTSSLLLVFGGWTDDNPTYKLYKSGAVSGMGPRATKGGKIEPWVDTMTFGRLYRGTPPVQVVNPKDNIREQMWGDTTLLISYYSPNIVFTIRRPDVLEFAKDSNHSIFRVLRDDNQVLFVVAKYNNRIDSLKIITVPQGNCIPWPDCYYNYNKYFENKVELPKEYLDTMVNSLYNIPVSFKKPPDD